MKDNQEKRPEFFSEVVEIPDLLAKSHLLSLDGLRAVSIIIVVFFHILMSFKTPYSFDYFANLGVQFFFVISGFLITTLLIKEKVVKGSISLRNFYIRRFFRIIPVAYLYLLTLVILDVVLKLHLKVIYLATSFLFIRNFFETATGVDHLSTHYWSLSVEEQFYLIFPFILRKNFRLYIWFLLGILAFSLLLDILSFWDLPGDTGKGVESIIVRLITQFQGIAIGSLASIMLFKAKPSFKIQNKGSKTLALLFLIIVLTYFQGGLFFYLMIMMKCALFAMILVINLNAADNAVFKVLNSNSMKLIGVLSFSIYIWQQPFTQGLNFINQTRMMKHFSTPVPMDLLITLVSLLILGVISCLSYFYYEKTFLKMRDRFR